MARTIQCKHPQRTSVVGGRVRLGFKRSNKPWFRGDPVSPVEAEGARYPHNAPPPGLPTTGSDQGSEPPPAESRLDYAKYQKCLALADEADGISDALVRLKQKLSKRGALGKINNARKIVGKSLKRLVHSMSMLRCRKYNIQPTKMTLRKRTDKDGREIDPSIERPSRVIESRQFSGYHDWKRGYKH